MEGITSTVPIGVSITIFLCFKSGVSDPYGYPHPPVPVAEFPIDYTLASAASTRLLDVSQPSVSAPSSVVQLQVNLKLEIRQINRGESLSFPDQIEPKVAMFA